MRQFVGPLVVVLIGVSGQLSAQTSPQPAAPAAATGVAPNDAGAERAPLSAALEARLTTENALLKAHLAAAKQEVRQLTADLANKIAIIDSLIQGIGLRTDEIRQQVELIATQRAQVGDMQLTILKLTSDATNLATALADSQKRQRGLEIRLEREIDRYQALDAKKASIAKVEGAVETPARNLVEIAVGMDDGVKRGMIMDVVREGKVIGRIKVLYTSTHASVGEELAEFKKEAIGKDDRVVTRTE